VKTIKWCKANLRGKLIQVYQGPRGGFYYRTGSQPIARKVYLTELDWDVIGKENNK